MENTIIEDNVRPFDHFFEADYDNLRVTFGGELFPCRSFVKGVRLIDVCKHTLGINNLKMDTPTLYKTFADTYKVKPSVFKSTLEKACYKVLCEDIGSNVLHACCYNGPHKRTLLIPDDFYKTKPILIQAVEDGNANITPILTVLKSNPSECKKMLGKSVWKQLCTNSLTRNSLISYRAVGKSYNSNSIVNVIKRLVDVPSSVLKYSYKYMCHTNINVVCKLLKEIKKLSCTCTAIYVTHTYIDTEYMLKREGGGVNTNWSYKRLIKEHEDAVKRVNAKKYSKVSFLPNIESKASGIVGHQQFNEEGFKATLLTTPYDIAMEGKTMRHCVASYIERCKEGRYFVYHIEGSDGEKATLGLFHSVLAGYMKIQQLYGPCNMKVSVGIKEFCDRLVSSINNGVEYNTQTGIL